MSAEQLDQQILALCSGEYKGDLEPADIAAMLGVPKAIIARRVYALRRCGKVAPGAYRLMPHVTVGDGHPYTLGGRILRLLKSGPMSCSRLHVELGNDAAGGALKRELKQMRLYGEISAPGCVWPSEVTSG